MKNSVMIGEVKMYFNSTAKKVEFAIPSTMDGRAFLKFKDENSEQISAFKESFLGAKGGNVIIAVVIPRVHPSQEDIDIVLDMMESKTVEQWNEKREKAKALRSQAWISQYIDSQGLISKSKINNA